jgi:hypothetical protein
MKQALVPCAAALLAVPQAASAVPLCDQLDAFAAAQWSEPSDPAPRHWVEFHWGLEGDSASRWTWACRYSGDPASGEFCNWLMDNTSREFTALPFNLLKCMDSQSSPQVASPSLFIEGEIRRRAPDGSWFVLEMASSALRPGESAVRISFDSSDRRLDPATLPPIEPFSPEVQEAAAAQ